MEVKLSLDKIAEELFKYIPKMNADEQNLSLSLYKSLARGTPVSAKDLAEYAGVRVENAEAFLKNRFGVYADNDGNVIGYLGLAISEMDYEFNVGGKKLFTWCAWDSLFITPLLSERAEVKSTDPNTGKDLQIEVSADGTTRSDSGDVYMSVLIPGVSEEDFAAGLARDIISSFCHHVYFFESKDSAAEFVSDKKEQYAILTLDEATELSRMWNEYVHGEALAKQNFAGVAY